MTDIWRERVAVRFGEENQKLRDEIERLRKTNEIMVRALNAISCQDADCKDDGVVWCAQRARSALEEKE